MRFFNGPGASNDTITGQNADVVVQIGDEKTALKAAQLLDAASFLSHGIVVEPSQPDNPHQNMPDGEIKAMEVLASMKAALQVPPTQHPDAGRGPWNPFSPDDCYPYDIQPKRIVSNNDSESLPRLHRESSDANLPAYYDPAEQPSYLSRHNSASSVRDMALHRAVPTIFDNLASPPIEDRKSHGADFMYGKSLRQSKSRSELKMKPLDLTHILSLPKQTNARPRSRSSIGMPDRTDLPLTLLSADRKLKKTKPLSTTRPTTSGSGAAGRIRPFDEAILDQHKTNVRRPPKGIKNWFDAYIVDDEDEDDEDEDGNASDELVQQEPQELPAEEVVPQAYTAPDRQNRTAVVSRLPHDSYHTSQQAVGQVVQRPGLSRNRSSDTSNSVQSSDHDQERRRPGSSDGRGTSTLGQDSNLSPSESEYDDEMDDGEGTARGRLPALRDSILNAREITIANASSVDLMRPQKPTQLHSVRPYGHGESKRGSQQSLDSAASVHRREKLLPMPPLRQNQAYDTTSIADAISLRRLNGLSVESDITSGTTDTSNTGMTGETGSSGTSFQDPGPAPPLHDPSHIMAVTEEEMMLLDLIRQRRAAMQQMSFTEGYQLALRTEQQRHDKRTSSAEQRASRSLKQKESLEQHRDQHRASDMSATAQTPTQETEMRRQLSEIRNQQVDDKFQMKRFLGMSQPQPLSSHPPEGSKVMHSRAPSGETLPATTYSPVVHSSPATSNYDVASSYFSDCESEAARMRVKQFITSKGAPPPLNSGMKKMRRRTSRQNPSIPPSPVAEEASDRAPPLPVRNPGRPSGRYHERNASQYTVSTLHGASSSSLYDETRDRSPVSTFSGGIDGTRRLPSDSPGISPLQEKVLLPPKPDAPTHAQFVSKSSSTPHLSFSAISPLGNLINNASKVTVRTSPYSKKSSETSQHAEKSPSDKKSERRATLHRLHTVDSVLQGSMPRARESSISITSAALSITSAGEEVLGAWADLGGGRDGLQVKRRT